MVKYVEKQLEILKNLVESNNLNPQLAIIQVGNVEASNRYIRNKIKDCAKAGVTAHHYWYDSSITEKELIQEVADLVEHYDGMIVQLPLPPHINSERVVEVIPAVKDVDGFNGFHDPCTPGGIIDYLTNTGFEFSGKNAVVIGRSQIVGRPMARLLTDKDMTVTLCHSKTKNLDTFIKTADLIICAVGKPNFLNCYSIHVPVFDVGINFDENGKLVGDCYNTINRNVSPVPGGVGLLTRCKLVANTVKAAMISRNLK